ncbi:unnamed protein product [Hydatigera taeniaeformis]|uniref:PBPe domain-containing protein n=1 Tax=Hydatigena taeniaeformis TaxID=6205 RepID=A0A158RDE9_HYDTA|nr:unnamed protein product [Hydatigera taeniaeformis]
MMDTDLGIWVYAPVLASLLESSVNEAQVVWSGIGGLFRNRFNESPPAPCITQANVNNLDQSIQLDANLNAILESMQKVANEVEQESIVSEAERCTLQDTTVTYLLFSDSCDNIKEYNSTVKSIKKWVQPIQSSITFRDSFGSISNDTIDGNHSAPPSTIYLSEFLVELAVISNRTGAEFYSTTMEAITAYAPPVRNSMSIKFLQNVESTIATVCSSLLQEKQTGITFIYDDNNKLIFLIRLLKNVYFSTIYLPSGWENNSTIKDILIQQFQNTVVPQTYVLLFQDEHSESYTNDFLGLAMLHQQLREGIQIILFSTYIPFYENGTGFSIPVMDTLAFLAKVNYELVIFKQSLGEPYYEKMLKAIENREIYVGFTPVPLSTLSTGNLSSSSATLTISFTLVRQRPSRPADFLLLLRPLSLPVWLASVVLAFIFTGLLMVFGHLKPVIMRNLAEGEMTSKRDLFEVSALGVASTFSLTKLQIIPTTLSSRIFALLMWMFSYLLLVIYASAMMTILLRIRTPSNADITVDTVLDSKSCQKLIVIEHGIGYDSIIASLHNISKSHTPVNSVQAAYDALMKDDKTVLLASSIEASYIGVMNCALEMIPYTSLYEIILSFPYYKPWTFGSELDYYFSIISKSGILTNAASVYFETGRCYQPNYNVPKPSVLELGDMASIYIFLLIGIIVSFIIMGLELLVKHIVGKQEAQERTLLVPGRQYTAKIVSIKRTGVNVNVADRPEVVFIPNSQLHTDPLKVTQMLFHLIKSFLTHVYNALDMGLAVGDSIEVTYFGKASDGETELFCRHFPNE